jgi:signal transduction histidine kinase
VAARIRELSSDVHRLAYELHPAKLDQLGLETASRSWCRDVAVHSGIRVSFVSREVPADVRPDIALCLFRIVQEALRNVVRHSRASEAHVQLTGGQGVMRLAVTDAGCGFDAAAASSKSGLGLISMRERVRLLRGTIDIESQPGTGTVISVSVPLPPAGA